MKGKMKEKIEGMANIRTLVRSFAKNPIEAIGILESIKFTLLAESWDLAEKMKND